MILERDKLSLYNSGQENQKKKKERHERGWCQKCLKDCLISAPIRLQAKQKKKGRS